VVSGRNSKGLETDVVTIEKTQEPPEDVSQDNFVGLSELADFSRMVESGKPAKQTPGVNIQDNGKMPEAQIARQANLYLSKKHGFAVFSTVSRKILTVTFSNLRSLHFAHGRQSPTSSRVQED
jgi:hypothetical protein